MFPTVAEISMWTIGYKGSRHKTYIVARASQAASGC